jgi:hypothetical protein
MDNGLGALLIVSLLVFATVAAIVYALSALARRFLPNLPAWLRIAACCAPWPAFFLLLWVWSHYDCAILAQQERTLWQRDGDAIGCAIADSFLPIFAAVSLIAGLFASLLSASRT